MGYLPFYYIFILFFAVYHQKRSHGALICTHHSRGKPAAQVVAQHIPRHALFSRLPRVRFWTVVWTVVGSRSVTWASKTTTREVLLHYKRRP